MKRVDCEDFIFAVKRCKRDANLCSWDHIVQGCRHIQGNHMIKSEKPNDFRKEDCILIDREENICNQDVDGCDWKVDTQMWYLCAILEEKLVPMGFANNPLLAIARGLVELSYHIV